MHGKGRFANVIFDPSLQPKNAVLAILLLLLFLIFVFLFLTLTAPLTQAQTPVPATARQAATMPQFASRLHPSAASRQPHLYQPKASYRNPRGTPQSGWLPDDGTVYENGPINGTTDAWTINNGFVVSDTFTVASGGQTANGMSFGAWLEPGDVLDSVQVSITSSEFGGTAYYNMVVNFTQSGCSGNQYGFNVCTETSDSSFGSVNLAAGTYWVNLANAVVNNGDPIYWDENSGVGCDSPGCPSSASENSIGTLPSEAFTILGGNSTCGPIQREAPVPEAKVVTKPPSPTQTYNVIYNFTGAGDGGGGTALAIDAAGNLYGTSGGGPFGAGTAFKLARTAVGWLYTRLYAFSGSDGSGPNSPLAVAADGELYGSTAGGGGAGDGTLFGLSAPGHISPTVFANWIQRLQYSFTGGNDGAQPQGSIALDNSGNIYGAAGTGGANGGGTVYEFTNGGLQDLHAFPAFSGDGVNPLGVVSGAGGLYGLTYSGGADYSGTVYTLAGGYNILYNFNFWNGGGQGGWPVDLAADQSGNLYVSATNAYLVNNCYLLWDGTIFELTYPDWTPETLMSWGNVGPVSAWVTPDAAGNVYGTVVPGYGDGEVFKLSCCWTYTTLHQFSGSPDGAVPAAGVVIDAQGNIYGTTAGGGAYGHGVIYEITP